MLRSPRSRGRSWGTYMTPWWQSGHLVWQHLNTRQEEAQQTGQEGELCPGPPSGPGVVGVWQEHLGTYLGTLCNLEITDMANSHWIKITEVLRNYYKLPEVYPYSRANRDLVWWKRETWIKRVYSLQIDNKLLYCLIYFVYLDYLRRWLPLERVAKGFSYLVMQLTRIW